MQPVLRLGAESPFGLALPFGTPTASQLYAQRGVWLGDDRLIVADSGNHRVLIWHSISTQDGTPNDVVPRQPDFASEGAAEGGRSVARGLHRPTAVSVVDGHLVVADAWHHRVVIWDGIPETSYAAPRWVIGQSTPTEHAPNRGDTVTATSLYWPYGLAEAGGWFWIADTGNRRVLGWPSLPLAGEGPAVILGQDNAQRNAENRGAAPAADSFRWPHAIAGDGHSLYIADAGNHRVLGWTPPPTHNMPAALVLGQRSFEATEELPHRKQGAHRLRFPYSVDLARARLFVADTANNRVLVWNGLRRAGMQRSADAVIGQPDFDAAGENRQTAVAPDTLCWPHGLSSRDDRVAIADSGNNRVVVWDLSLFDAASSVAPAGSNCPARTSAALRDAP